MVDNYSKTLIILFSLMLFLLLASSIALFGIKIGFEPIEIANFYMGNNENFVVKKSLDGLFETTAPHLFAITAMIFIIIHFLLFTKYKKYASALLSFLLISFMADMSSGYFLIYNLSFFAVIKLVSFIMFELLFAVSIFLIAKDTITHNLKFS